jgi:hypothetical protein
VPVELLTVRRVRVVPSTAFQSADPTRSIEPAPVVVIANVLEPVAAPADVPYPPWLEITQYWAPQKSTPWLRFAVRVNV